MTSKFRSTIRPNHPGVVQPIGRLGVFSFNQKKNPVLRIATQKQSQDDNNTNNYSNKYDDEDTEKQPISDFPTPPIPICSCYRGQQGEMPNIPNLTTAAHGEITSLVLAKMKLCQRTCDFSDPRADLGAKATKQATLNELIDLYCNQKLLPKLTRECHQQLIETFAANVFRSSPQIPKTVIVNDEVTTLDNAWPHLRLVYLLFIKFLSCGVEQRILQFQLTPKFISNLFSILDFPDERERVQVRTVIVTIYNKVPPQRTLLMNITLDLLMNVPENLQLNASSHLLELLCQFTSNTPPPLSQQLIQAFDRILLPLHLPAHCQHYFPSLEKCILLMIHKDARLANNVLHFLIEHWPLTLDHKTELFLNEIMLVLEDSNPQDLTENATSLFNCVSITVESPCTNVSEKALKFLQHNSIQNLIVENPDPLLEIIFPPLFRVTCGHWQKTVQVSALNVMNILMELTPDAFKKAAEQFKTKSLLSKKRKVQKYNLWIDVLEVSAMKDSSIDVDVVAEGIREFYSTEKRPPSRAPSSQASSRSNNNNNNENNNSNGSNDANNDVDSKKNDTNNNLNENDALKSSSDSFKFENKIELPKAFSNPFKALASNFTRRGSAGVFHYEVEDSNPFQNQNAALIHANKNASMHDAASIGGNQTKSQLPNMNSINAIGFGSISEDGNQNHETMESLFGSINKEEKPATSINNPFGSISEEGNQNHETMESLFSSINKEEKPNLNSNETGFSSISEEGNQNQDTMESLFSSINKEEKPATSINNPFGSIVEEGNQNQDTMESLFGSINKEEKLSTIINNPFGSIVEEERPNLSSNTTNFGSISEEGNQAQSQDTMESLFGSINKEEKPNSNPTATGFSSISEEGNTNQNQNPMSSLFGSITEEEKPAASSDFAGFGSISEEGNLSQNAADIPYFGAIKEEENQAQNDTGFEPIIEE